MSLATVGRRWKAPVSLFALAVIGCIGVGSAARAAAAESLKGDTEEVDGLKVSPLNLDVKVMLPCLQWADEKGSAFFALDGNGVLRRVSYPEFKVTKEKDFERKCAWLALSAEGLVVTLPDPQEVLILDPQTFEEKGKIAVPALKRAVAAPTTSVGIATAGDRFNAKLYVLNLKTRKAIKYALPEGGTTRLVGFDDPKMTPDGQYLFTRGGMEEMFRFHNVAGKWKPEEVSPRIAQGRVGAGIQISPDSKLVCLPCGGGNYGAGAYSTFVYPMTTFKKTACTLEQGAYPQAVGFDPAGGYIYSQNSNSALIVFTMTGIKKKEYRWGKRLSEVRQYLPHPDGNKLLVLMKDRSYFVEVPPKNK